MVLGPGSSFRGPWFESTRLWFSLRREILALRVVVRGGGGFSDSFGFLGCEIIDNECASMKKKTGEKSTAE